MSEGIASPGSADSAIDSPRDCMDNMYRAELELEVNHRVTEALKKAYERDADEFRSMMEQFEPKERSSAESRDLHAENRSLRRELSQAQASIDELKAMIPTAVGDV